jgi:hypothetical protein
MSNDCLLFGQIAQLVNGINTLLAANKTMTSEVTIIIGKRCRRYEFCHG